MGFTGSDGQGLAGIESYYDKTLKGEPGKSIEKELTARYLEQFPEYEKTFQVFWVKSDDGARFMNN